MADDRLHWDTEALWEQLTAQLPGLSVEVVTRVASTNSTLLDRARVGTEVPPESGPALVRRSVESAAFGRRSADLQPCLLVAEHQTQGRGRQGREWQSASGASLTFSLSLPFAPADWSGMSVAVGMALADALDPPAEGAAPRIGVKWPNDLWLIDANGDGRKLGGILIETLAAGSCRLAVVGVGINVLPLVTTNTSSGFACLHEIDSKASAPRALMAVARPLVETLLQFERQGFEVFAERFARRDVLRGRAIRTTHPDVPEGDAMGVSPGGALLIRTPAGVVPLTSGEVSVRVAPRSGDT